MAAAAYKQFLASPSSALLADTASLHYVTTLTSISGATEIIKHLNTHQKQVKKKKEEIIHLVDGQNTIALEIETGLEFQTSGGSYLPGIDDNFLSDEVVYLPIMHFVSFDTNGKISQIRQHWDQGALLKQIDIIGKSGRNWPIKSSKEQISLLQACAKSSGQFPVQNQGSIPARSRENSENAMRDPYASLHLFRSREEVESVQPEPIVSPYAGQKPKQRAFTDILTDEPGHGDHHRSPSKVGAGQNYQPMRIFEGQDYPESDEEDDKPTLPGRRISVHPLKYHHFDMDDGSEITTSPSQRSSPPFEDRPKSKHASQWSFEDFTTPVKPVPGRAMRSQNGTNTWSTDSVPEESELPAGKPRRDAGRNFELLEEDQPGIQDQPITTQKAGVRREGLTRGEEEADRALGNITNLKERGKVFQAQFALTDDAPIASQKPQNVSANRMKAVKTMDSSWAATDEAPVSQKENRAQNGNAQSDTKIHVAGDGMGGKKGANREWLYGDNEPTPQKPVMARNNGKSIYNQSHWEF